MAFESSLSWRAADGTDEIELLMERDGPRRYPNAFSLDGTVMVFHDWQRNLGLLSLEGDRRSHLLWETAHNERNADLSPDGRWLAYESNETDEWEVWVRPVPPLDAGGLLPLPSETRSQVSRDGGTWPLWNPAPDGGHELFYVGSDGMMAVTLDTGPTLRWDTPRFLFDTTGYGTERTVGTNRRIDISPDGKRFLMFKLSTPTAPDPILIQNWAEELERLVPTP